MQNGTWPASEVVRRLEDELQSAAVLRTRAEAMLAEAAERQRRVYDMAVEHLGKGNGEAAYNLACLSSNTDPSLRASSVHDGSPDARQTAAPISEELPAPRQSTAVAEPVVAPQVRRPEPASPVSPRAVTITAPVAAPSRAETDPDRDVDDGHDDPSRLVLYGVEIKRAKSREAEEVVSQARSAAAQGHKANPYAGQRGRNSWRDALYSAALAAFQGNAPAQPPEKPESVREPDAVPSAPEPVSVQAAPVFDHQSAPANAERSPASARAVPYTRNPAQSADTPPASRPPPPAVADPPAKPVGEVMHRPQPISGRVVALGQASPMPDGLKEEVQRREEMRADPNPAPASPAAGPVTALKPVVAKPLTARRPSFLNR